MAWIIGCHRFVSGCHRLISGGLRKAPALLQLQMQPSILISRGYLTLPEIPPLPESYDGTTFEGPIPMDQISRRYVLSQGPGGQCVQKTDSKAYIHFDLNKADWLPLWIRERMRKMYKQRINKDGEFSVTCDVFRSQMQNLDGARDKLKKMIVAASELPDKRYKSTIKAAKQQKKATDRKKTSSAKHKKLKEERLAKYAPGIEAAKAAKEGSTEDK